MESNSWQPPQKERHRLGLDGKVILSHNFTHHLEIADDYVGRMTPAGRAALRRYIRGLDALSLSQYMDLTAAVPAAERGQRLPTVTEISDALVLAEKNFRHDILEGALGLRPKEIPPLHIGEFGVGRGGLKHPNLWAGETTPAEEKPALAPRRIARSAMPACHSPTWPAPTDARSAAPSSGSPAATTTSSAGRSRATPTPRRSPPSRRRWPNKKARPRLRSRARSDVLVADAVADVEAYLVAYLAKLLGDDVVDIERVGASGEGPAVER